MKKTLFIAMVVSLFAARLHAAADDYYGSVAVNSPAGLGNIDLAFHLVMDDYTGTMDNARSYIILEKTILFPKSQTQVDGKDVGPMIQSGYLNETDFYLETQPFQGTVSQKTVTRKITLSGIPQTEAGNSITGTYTEIISGYPPDDIVVAGDFILARPVSASSEALTMDLQRVIKMLQLCAGMDISIDKALDINGNDKIDIAEAIHALQTVAGIR